MPSGGLRFADPPYERAITNRLGASVGSRSKATVRGCFPRSRWFAVSFPGPSNLQELAVTRLIGENDQGTLRLDSEPSRNSVSTV